MTIWANLFFLFWITVLAFEGLSFLEIPHPIRTTKHIVFGAVFSSASIALYIYAFDPFAK